jgi:hypothetical protein
LTQPAPQGAASGAGAGTTFKRRSGIGLGAGTSTAPQGPAHWALAGSTAERLKQAASRTMTAKANANLIS